MARRKLIGAAETAESQAPTSPSAVILEAYLNELKAVHATGAGVAETSYYPALSNLFNAVGKALRPKVRCVMNLKNLGAGMPDGGLFTPEQFLRQADGALKAGQLPARGAIEAKGTKPAVKAIAASKQVKEYLGAYGIVVVTNLRDFLIVERGPDGEPLPREGFTLADDESDFWKHKAAHPRTTAQEQGRPFVEFIGRACLHAAPLINPKDVAWFLASYARDALYRVERQKELPALQSVRTALEEALGMKFTAEKGEHFFRSTLVQTLFYGVFSAWVLWHRERPARTDAFNWHEAEWSLHVPFIRALYHEIASPVQLGSLQLVEVLDWTAGALNRVDREAFFEKFRDDHAVQYFYEPFLEAFDPQLRKQLGVWYTPPEIVQYQVARVDTVLREELGVADGLADPNVIVLDPCCGTGAYLVEALRKIRAILRDKGDDALVGYDVKTAAMKRVFGFEILPAAFVVAHLQIGLLLHEAGLPLSAKKSERLAVYLTNSLTGWEPPKEPKTRLLFPELAAEREAADDVKRGERILVILGNPPYNGFAGVAVGEERALTEAYRTTKQAPAPQGQGLNELYVRFYRMAERRIVEMNKPAKGVVCFISNYSWLDGLSFTGMREHYLDAFDKLWIDCLNGDKYKTGKLTPEGQPDPSVFSTQHNREGIQVGTAIALMLRKEDHKPAGGIAFRHFWGRSKRADLAAAAQHEEQAGYANARPGLEMGLSLFSGGVGPGYLRWPALPEVLPVSFPGVKTSRDEFLVAIDREVLLDRLTRYFDPHMTDEELRQMSPSVMEDTASYRARDVRAQLLKRGGILHNNVVRYAFRPFDVRWLYWEPHTNLLDRKRADYFPHVSPKNLTLVAQQKPRREWSRPQVISRIGCIDLMDRSASCFPLYLSGAHLPKSLFTTSHAPRVPNLSEASSEYLRAVDCAHPEALFEHTVAILHSPAYSKENSGALRQDWPRVPLPSSRKALQESARLGRRIAELFDTEAEVHGVTASRLEAIFRTIGVLVGVGGGDLDPNTDDFSVTAGWGHPGKGGVTMPAKGRVIQRPFEKAELDAIGQAAESRGLSAKKVRSLLGQVTWDVFLNDRAYWRNVPANVWNYFIGGYQVIKKWLSYRERDVLGRPISPEEAREVTNIARRLAAILLLQPALDANYEAVKASTYAWPREAGPGSQ